MKASYLFSRDRYGRPQVVAVLLLLAFAGQCLWLMSRRPLTETEVSIVQQGRAQLQGGGMVDSAERSPLVYVLAALPTLRASDWRWSARMPFLISGVLLAASLWYVSRRLYGNAAGYIALTLYAFSPMTIIHSANVRPEMVAAWGAFGCIFTGIAVAHTLYAPREVVLWNWKRILLLGMAIGVGVGAQFAVIVTVVVTLGFMLYLVPQRRGAALTILGAACAIGLAVIWMFYGFQPRALWEGVSNTQLGGWRPGQLSSVATWRMLGTFFLHSSPGVVLLALIAIVTYAAWPRTRFFGTTAPLLVSTLLLALAVVLPRAAGSEFLVVALPFVLVFTAGVLVDLLESRQPALALGVITAVLVAHAVYSVAGLLAH
ncbi:MAG: ArnT family glycosyltransferase [Terriglobales bacterium]